MREVGGVKANWAPATKTLTFDIGGTGLKASLIDMEGELLHERIRILTPYPLTPGLLVESLVSISKELPKADRISAGFPGVIRDGKIITAPHFIFPNGPSDTSSPPDQDLISAWSGFDLASELGSKIGLPAKVANDADLAGSAVITGVGLELVVTLGTGFGTGMFLEGKLLPHLEIAHMPFSKGGTFDDQLGDHERKTIGNKRWSKRVEKAIKLLRVLVNFDHLYIGGGNSSKMQIELENDITVVSNDAGLKGGIKLWDV